MPTSAAERSLHVDALRGFAMTCVVLGHAIQRNVGFDAPLFLVLAAFEMPLFAFVSGYLTRLAPDAGLGATALTRARRLLVPFVAWAPVMWAVSRFAWSGLDVQGIPASLGAYLGLLFAWPRSGLWYLLVLFYWWMIVIVARACFGRLTAGSLVFGGGVAVVLGVVAGRLGLLTPAADFGFRILVDLLPFFFAGWVLRNHARPLDAEPPGRAATTGAAIAGAALLGLMVASVLAEPAVLPPGRWSPDDVFFRLWDYLQAALGVGGSLLLLRSRVFDRLLAPFALAGRSSMGIYAIHLMFLRTGFGEGWVMAASSFAIAMAVSLVGTGLLRKSRCSAEVFLGELRPNVKTKAESAAAG